MKQEKYNQQREELIKTYRNKKLLNAIIILVAAAVIITVINLLPEVFNIAVRLVASALLIIFTVILVVLRVSTLEATKRRRLELLEQHEPTFRAKF